MSNYLIALLVPISGVLWFWGLIHTIRKSSQKSLEREMNMTPEEKEARLKRQAEYRTKQMEKERREMESSQKAIGFVFSIIVLVIILAVIKWAFATVFG